MPDEHERKKKAKKKCKYRCRLYRVHKCVSSSCLRKLVSDISRDKVNATKEIGENRLETSKRTGDIFYKRGWGAGESWSREIVETQHS